MFKWLRNQPKCVSEADIQAAVDKRLKEIEDTKSLKKKHGLSEYEGLKVSYCKHDDWLCYRTEVRLLFSGATHYLNTLVKTGWVITSVIETSSSGHDVKFIAYKPNPR